MSSSLLTLASVASLSFLAGCGAPSERLDSDAPRSRPLPTSALAGTVRALEALVAQRPADCLVQLSALESERLVGHGGQGEYVRVFLHVTLYADSTDRAWTAFEELESSLQDELSRPSEEPDSLQRARKTLAELDWNPPGREDLASYSKALRLEVAPGRGGPAASAEQEALPGSHKPLEEYVRWLAGREQVGAVALAPFMDHEGNRRLRISEGGPTLGHTRSEIADFLEALESESPAVRLTRVEIERSQDQADLQDARGWVFEAELAAQPVEAAYGEAN